MKNLVMIILLVVVAILGYRMVNQPVKTGGEQTSNTTEQTMDKMAPASDAAKMTQDKLTTPADMPKAAQEKMMHKIVNYQKCMLRRRPEYMNGQAKMTDMVDKTIQLCEPELTALDAVLQANHVNENLRKKMVHTMRSKAARKLMSNVMKSMAAQASVTSGVTPGTVSVPDASGAQVHP